LIKESRERKILILLGGIFFFSVLIREFPHSSFSGKSSPIDLNNANIEDLVTLPGMGYKTAIKIIGYRETHGPFKSLEELLEIEGISIKKFKKWKPYFKIQDTDIEK